MEGLKLFAGDWSALEHQCRSVRDEVFVAEQNVPIELEHDANDPVCLHVVAISVADGVAVGTGRLLPDGHIGRMAVRKPWRAQGVGGAMLALLIEEARERGHAKVVLNAQLSAEAFYRAFGFKAVGEVFREAGIDHQTMELAL